MHPIQWPQNKQIEYRWKEYIYNYRKIDKIYKQYFNIFFSVFGGQTDKKFEKIGTNDHQA